MLNEMSEFKELKSNPHRDFYNVRKVRPWASVQTPPGHPLSPLACAEPVWAGPLCGLPWAEQCDVTCRGKTGVLPSVHRATMPPMVLGPHVVYLLECALLLGK